MADTTTQIRSLIVGDDVRWTNFTNYQRNTQYLRPLGSPTVVTFSFENTLPSYMMAAAASTARPLTDAEKNNVRAAASIWDNASGLVMMEVGAGQGQIAISAYDFRTTGNNGFEGIASYPGFGAGGDVYLNTANEITVGLSLHELGHALGLKHPFEPLRTGVTLPAAEDNSTNTVMSYTGGFKNQIGPYDQAAIQYLYGPNVSTDKVYPAGYTAQSYLAANPDLLRAFGTNLGAANYHYLAAGIWEGRSTTFDGLEYIASNADLVRAFGADEQAGANHYVYSGYQEGRSTSGFNPFAYLASHRDLEAAFGRDAKAATLHYISNGVAEGRAVTFDADGYLATNRDLMIVFGSDRKAAARHFLGYGRNEGRNTTGFDANAYLAANADLRVAFGTDTAAATRHYVDSGFREGRPTFVYTSSTSSRAAMASSLEMTGGENQFQSGISSFAGFAAASEPQLTDVLPRLSAAVPETNPIIQPDMTMPVGLMGFGTFAREEDALTIGFINSGSNWF